MTAPADWFHALPTDRLMAEMSMWSGDLGRSERPGQRPLPTAMTMARHRRSLAILDR